MNDLDAGYIQTPVSLLEFHAGAIILCRCHYLMQVPGSCQSFSEPMVWGAYKFNSNKIKHFYLSYWSCKCKLGSGGGGGVGILQGY